MNESKPESNSNASTSVKVAVRIRPLSDYEIIQDSSVCVNVVPGETQIQAGDNTSYTFDHVFGHDCSQEDIYSECVSDLLNAVFEGFNATILAYGQTGSGKTYTMGSSSDMAITEESFGIIPRVIKSLFQLIELKEEDEAGSTFKVYVQFLEIYGEDIRDLLDATSTSKVIIRETRGGEVFVTGAREELVSSFEQMMKTLEDGTKNRTTASTKMNLTSSRSHAIFTVNLEHIRYTEIDKENIAVDIQQMPSSEGADTDTKKDNIGSAPLSREVSRCKFHFVDLAGSERIKRTGAEGKQLKEGIDINKGLLALGNVISALGDDTKRGKVFVPYRDSKLTRMLQDSLGGNSKTLMICCVSPAAVNFNESVNALRYANRARNIKNKPVVNRDPTVVIIEELRSTLKLLASELLEMRKSRAYKETDPRITNSLLESLAVGSIGSSSRISSADEPKLAGSRPSAAPSDNSKYRSPVKSPLGGGSGEGKLSREPVSSVKDLQIAELKRKLADSDFEVRRLSDSLKQAKLQASELSDRLILTKAESEYFKMKWSDVCPQEAQMLERGNETKALTSSAEGEKAADVAGESTLVAEKQQFVQVVSKYSREIDGLRQELASEKSKLMTQIARNDEETVSLEVENEFTSSIANLISQTRDHLEEESRKLKSVAMQGRLSSSSHSDGEADTEEGSLTRKTSSDKVDEVEAQRIFAKRQRMLSAEVQELNQSIVLKEQLMSQLVRSQEQYSRMRAFYEQRLTALSEEMQEKQVERERLLQELQEIATEKSEAEAIKARESRLRQELKKKDEELVTMKKKQQELTQLSQSQTQYVRQLNKLEEDIISMKKQRIDLQKTLQVEKRNHLSALSEKAREIDRLKKELYRASTEVRRLGKASELAEAKMKDALKEGAILKKKALDTYRASIVPQEGAAATTSATRTAIKAISQAASRQKTSRAPTGEELRTKRWLDQKIAEISAREAAVDKLKTQYEQQLELLKKKEKVEAQRKQQSSSLSLSLSSSAAERTQSTAEDEEEIQAEAIEERLSSLNGQLNAHRQKITEICNQLHKFEDFQSHDEALDALRRTATSVSASHELIRMLFDMVIQSNKASKLKEDQVYDLLDKERSYQQKLEEMHAMLASEKRTFDSEITQLTTEYEEKYQVLFQHISAVSTPKEVKIDPLGDLEITPVNSTTSTPSEKKPSALRRGKSVDSVQLQLTVSAEECKFLKTQLDRETLKYSQLQEKYFDALKIKTGLAKDIAEKNSTIRFLEEERNLFKSMAEEMKAGLRAMGKDGKLAAASIKGKWPNSHRRSSGDSGLFSEYLYNSEDEEEESNSILGEFDSLADEINRGLSVRGSALEDNAMGSGSSQSPPLSGASMAPKSTVASAISIYERLTNPSNFTGAMRSVFENDLASKRKKTQLIRNQEKSLNAKREAAAAVNPSRDPRIANNNYSSADESTASGGARAQDEATASLPPAPPTNATGSASATAAGTWTAPSLIPQSSKKLPRQISTARVDESAESDGPQQNVFSRLTSSYTGVHKYGRFGYGAAAEDASQSQSQSQSLASSGGPSTLGSSSSNRNNSPSRPTELSISTPTLKISAYQKSPVANPSQSVAQKGAKANPAPALSSSAQTLTQVEIRNPFESSSQSFDTTT